MTIEPARSRTAQFRSVTHHLTHVGELFQRRDKVGMIRAESRLLNLERPDHRIPRAIEIAQAWS